MSVFHIIVSASQSYLVTGHCFSLEHFKRLVLMGFGSTALGTSKAGNEIISNHGF